MATSTATKRPATEAKEKSAGLDVFRKDSICVVVATHDTGHGESQAVLQIVKNPHEAIETARTAEKLGYRFYGDETGISVYYIEIGRQYSKKEFEFFDKKRLPVNYPVIFRRYKMNGEWREEWFSEMMKYVMGLD